MNACRSAVLDCLSLLGEGTENGLVSRLERVDELEIKIGDGLSMDGARLTDDVPMFVVILEGGML